MTAEAAGVDEVHILWTSEGLSCDGDTVSVTAASLPSIEEVLLGAVPGLPKVDRLLRNLDAVHPGVPRMLVSAKTGEGVGQWRDWLVERAARAGAPA